MNPQPLHPAEALFDKCIDQSLSPQEQAQLDAWVCADARNAEALARWLLAHAQTAEGLSMGLAMAPQVAGRLPHRKPAAGGVPLAVQFGLTAAGLALAVGAGAWVWLATRDQAPPAVAKAPVSPAPVPVPSLPPVALRPGEKNSPSSSRESKIAASIEASLTDPTMSSRHLQRLLFALAFLGSADLSTRPAVAQDTPPSAGDGTTPPPVVPPAPPSALPPAVATADPAADRVEGLADDSLAIPGIEKMSSTIQGSRRAIVRGDYEEAIKRLEELKGKKQKPEEATATAKLLDYAYANGPELQLKAIEAADPLKALQLFNRLKPPGSPGFYAPRLKDRIAAAEAKVRSPETQGLVKAGHEFNAIYDLFQVFPEEGKPKLEAFVAAHGADPYGQMAQRVLEGKAPTEESEVAVGGGGVAGASLDQAAILYPSEFRSAKGQVPKSLPELRKVCSDFLAQSEKALKAQTADVPECDAKFWRWLDSRPAMRTGLLLAKNPVPAPYVINLAKFYKKFGEKACGKYGQLVLAAALTEEDVTIGGHNYGPGDFTENQRKVGEWLWKNQSKVEFWRFVKEPKKYAEMAGGTLEGVTDTDKMAYLSHTYPPRIRSSRMQNVRIQILQQEAQVPGVQWPLFPVAQTPYILLNPVAACNEAMRDREYIWNMFAGRAGYPGNANPGMQPVAAAAPKVGTRIHYGKYGFEYTRPDVALRQSLWHPTNVIRIAEDGGVCGRMATSCSLGEAMLGIPSTPAGQPGHCALMTVSYSSGQYGASIGQSVTGTWMNTGPGVLGVSPAVAGHDHDAVSWLALTRTVNRVGMENYHASLVAAYMAETVSNSADKRGWLELAVRLNPYHLAATEKIWAMAAQGGVNALNKSIQQSVERMALKKGKSIDEMVLHPDDALILRRLSAALPKQYDAALERAGNTAPVQDYGGGEYVIGQDGASAAAEPSAQPGIAAGSTAVATAGGNKQMIKNDLELMFRYMLAFQKKGLMYGFASEVFLKHVARVDPEVGRKMLNQLLEEAFKLPIPTPENMDKGDCPLYVCIQGLTEMDSKLSSKDRSKGLLEICTRLEKAGARLVRHNHPSLVYGTTIFVDDAQTHPIYLQVADLLDKALRDSGPEGIVLADKVKRKYDADFAKLDYQCKLEAYAKTLPLAGGRKLEKPKPPVFDKQGALVKDAAKAAADADAARLKRGEGVKAE